MPAPELSHTAQQFYDSVEPLAYADDDNDWALAYLCKALAGSVEEVAELSRDQDDDGPEGYAGLWAVDTVEEKWLPWIAQFIGVTMPPGLSDTAKRIRIHETDGFKRGTPAAIIGAAQQYLIGDRTVHLIERYGSAYMLIVGTYDTETTENNYDDFATTFDTFDEMDAEFASYDTMFTHATRVTQLIEEQIPGGIQWEHRIIDPTNYTAVSSTHSNYTDIASTYTSYAEIVLDPDK